MPNQHKHPNLTFRPPESDRAWLLAYVERTGRPRNAVLADALAMYRKRGPRPADNNDGGTEMAADYDGKPLSEGDRVDAWHDGVKYSAVVKAIRDHCDGDGDFRRLILVRDDDGTEVQSFSDGVRITGRSTEGRP